MKASSIDPIEECINKVTVLLQSDDRQGAFVELERFMSVHCELDVRIFRLLARVLQEDHRLTESIEAQKLALLLSPSPAEDLKRLGDLLNAAYRYQEAARVFKQAITLNPEDVRAHIGLAIASTNCYNWDEAIDTLEAAIRINPQDLLAHAVLVRVLRQSRQLDRALLACERALREDPCEPTIHTLRSLVRLSLCELELGWREYQWRFMAKDPVLERLHPELPCWDGFSTERPLLIWREQGIGDEIFHFGFLQQLHSRHPELDLILVVSTRLVPLCRRSFCFAQVISQEDSALQEWDGCSVPLASVGMHLHPSLELAEGRPHRYIHTNPDLRNQIRAELVASGTEPLVGISWLSIRQGYTTHKSVPLKHFQCLQEAVPLRLVNLQYGDVGEKIQWYNQSAKLAILDPPIDKLGDLDSLAALIDACDLVITISNVTAHLACALGKECWILLPSGWALPWFWHLNGETTPWYPTARLFRQGEDRHWEPIFESMGQLLVQRFATINGLTDARP